MCLSFGTPTICCGVVRSAGNGGLEFSWYLAQMMSSHPQGALTGQSSRADADHVLMCSLLCHALSSCVWFRFTGWEQCGAAALSSHQAGVQEINVYYLGKKEIKSQLDP